MISAQQAAEISTISSRIHLVYDQIRDAARRNQGCVVVDHLTDDMQHKLQQDGYKVSYDECERGMSFWVISWKHACM